ncbi:DAD family-domain-containing protein [Lactarius quietus]|nr:DAD family-domain-containing protein [Lactarius quietus]
MAGPKTSSSTAKLARSSTKPAPPSQSSDAVQRLPFFLILSGVIQFVYCVLVTSFPFNAFLAGFASTVGQFVLTASLRSQVNSANRTMFKDVSPERCAFADFVVGSVVLHFFVFNFLG